MDNKVEEVVVSIIKPGVECVHLLKKDREWTQGQKKLVVEILQHLVFIRPLYHHLVRW